MSKKANSKGENCLQSGVYPESRCLLKRYSRGAVRRFFRYQRYSLLQAVLKVTRALVVVLIISSKLRNDLALA